MARNTEDIFNEIVGAKQADAELDILTSTSRVSNWKLWAYITAFAINKLEKLFDIFKKDVQSIIDSRRMGNLDWYARVSRSFQYGDTLEVNEAGAYHYLQKDAGKQIINRASAKEEVEVINNVERNLIRIKVIKEGLLGGEALEEDEMNQFIRYMERIKFAGVRIAYTSLEADQLNVSANIFHDGMQNMESLKENIKQTILHTLESLEFDEALNKNALIDALTDVEGVKDVAFRSIQGIQGTFVQDVERKYLSKSGHLKLNDLHLTFEVE